MMTTMMGMANNNLPQALRTTPLSPHKLQSLLNSNNPTEDIKDSRVTMKAKSGVSSADPELSHKIEAHHHLLPVEAEEAAITPAHHHDHATSRTPNKSLHL